MQAPSPTLPESELLRRDMLAQSDRLLEAVEELRLADQSRLPPTLGDAIRLLQARIGRGESPNPRTIHGAQLLVFAVQQRLMAANPRQKQPRSHLGRPRGMPRVTRAGGGVPWKELTLPPPAQAGRDGIPWSVQVELTVERAFDRWSITQDQAVAAARTGERSLEALSRARAAWANYWDLRCEADRLLAPPPGRSERSSAAVTGSGEPETRAAKPSRKAPNPASSSPTASAMTTAAAGPSPGASTFSSWEAKS
jgi:hypothetical protein